MNIHIQNPSKIAHFQCLSTEAIKKEQSNKYLSGYGFFRALDLYFFLEENLDLITLPVGDPDFIFLNGRIQIGVISTRTRNPGNNTWEAVPHIFGSIKNRLMHIMRHLVCVSMSFYFILYLGLSSGASFSPYDILLARIVFLSGVYRGNGSDRKKTAPDPTLKHRIRSRNSSYLLHNELLCSNWIRIQPWPVSCCRTGRRNLDPDFD